MSDDHLWSMYKAIGGGFEVEEYVLLHVPSTLLASEMIVTNSKFFRMRSVGFRVFMVPEKENN